MLVNNAGIIRVTRLSDIALEEWELLQRVNATSVVLGIQAAAPALTRRGGGSIVNVASTAAHRGAEGYGAYSASKAAVLAITRAAALELAPNGIRVNSISPGGVETPMNDDEPPGGTSAATPLGRRAQPEGDLAAGRLPRDQGVRLRDRRRLPHRWRGDHPMTERRIALVAGAASGMGQSTAQVFLDRGWTVLALDLTAVDGPGSGGRLTPIKSRMSGTARPSMRRSRRTSRHSGGASTRWPTWPASTHRPRSRPTRRSCSTACSTSTSSASSTSPRRRCPTSPRGRRS